MQLQRNEVLEKSRIFKKGNNGTLTNYQQVINNAAYELCLENPNLINSKGELLNLSRVKVDEEGYLYKKKRSRSLAFGASNEESKEKRSKISVEIRHKRIKDLSEDINSINMSMALLEKERYKQHNMNKYAQAASLEEQISSKQKEKRVLEAELTMLQEKEVKSKRYHMSKESKNKKEASQGKTQNVQPKTGIQLSLFQSGIKPAQSKSNQTEDCRKSGENDMSTTENGNDDLNLTAANEEAKSSNGMLGNETKDIRKSGEKFGAAENTCVEKYDKNIHCEVQKAGWNSSVRFVDKTGENSETMPCDSDSKSTSGDHFL